MSLKLCAGTAIAAVLVVAAAEPIHADGAAGSPAAATPKAATAPATDDKLVADVRAAIVNHDLDFFEKQLVD